MNKGIQELDSLSERIPGLINIARRCYQKNQSLSYGIVAQITSGELSNLHLNGPAVMV